MEHKIRLEMKLDAKDIWLFSMYHTNRGYTLIFNVLFTVASIYYVGSHWMILDMSRRLIFILCALMFSVIQPAMLFLKAQKQAKSEAITNGVLLELSNEGILVEQSGQSGFFEWNTVFKAMIRKGMTVIYLDAMRAYLIPERYMGGDAQAIRVLLKEKTRLIRF